MQGELLRGSMPEIPATRASLLLCLRDPHDESAWTHFVELYAPVVYGYARKQGLQDADAADLCQEVLRAVASAVGRLEYDPARGAFRNWLFTVVRRKLWNWRAAQQNRTPASGDTATLRLLQQHAAPEVEEAAWDAECEDQLFGWACTQIRQDVSEATWRAFWRTAIDGEPGKDVARALGLSIAAVYSARSRVVSRLKDLIQSVHET
jgi:RNA polymerase sigma-70 factor (ECF subfamily)